MSFTSYGCRFCLRTIQANEKMAMIDDEVKEQFINLTQVKLDFIDGLSKVVCEVCLRSVQLATALKLQFVENQKKLYSEIEDIQVEAKRLPKVEVTDENIQEPEQKFINIPIQKAIPVKSTPKKPPAKKRKPNPKQPEISSSISNNSFDMHDISSYSVEPEINIKEEKFEEGEIQFNNQFYDQYNYLDTNPFDTNDSDDPSSMLEEMEVKNNEDPNTSNSNRRKVLVKTTVAGERVFPCVYCGKHYNKRHMSRHINVEHKKIKFPCVVDGCTSTYSRKEKLRLHIQTKHIVCTQEEYAELMERVRTLMPIYENVSHVDIDQPKIKFYCVVDGCQSNYTRKRKLKVHLAEKHSDLSPEEQAEVMVKFETLDPVYEMYEDPVVNPEDIVD